MSEAYRQKLLHWLISMLVLLLMATAGVTTLLLAGRFNPVVARNIYDPLILLGMAAESLLGFMIYGIPAAIWHIADFLEVRGTASRTVAVLSGYPLFGTILALGASAYALAASQVLTGQRCPHDEPGTFGFTHCLYGPPDWLWFAMLSLLLFASILCMGKAVIAIRSRMKKAA